MIVFDIISVNDIFLLILQFLEAPDQNVHELLYCLGFQLALFQLWSRLRFLLGLAQLLLLQLFSEQVYFCQTSTVLSKKYTKRSSLSSLSPPIILINITVIRMICLHLALLLFSAGLDWIGVDCKPPKSRQGWPGGDFGGESGSWPGGDSGVGNL